MQEYVKLKSGIEVPEETAFQHASEIYTSFTNLNNWWQDLLCKLSFLANQNFPKDLTNTHFTDYNLQVLENKINNFAIQPLWPRCTGAMAKTAMAASMIVASESDGDFECHLQEPLLDGKELLPILYEEYLRRKKATG